MIASSTASGLQEIEGWAGWKPWLGGNHAGPGRALRIATRLETSHVPLDFAKLIAATVAALYDTVGSSDQVIAFPRLNRFDTTELQSIGMFAGTDFVRVRVSAARVSDYVMVDIRQSLSRRRDDVIPDAGRALRSVAVEASEALRVFVSISDSADLVAPRWSIFEHIEEIYPTAQFQDLWVVAAVGRGGTWIVLSVRDDSPLKSALNRLQRLVLTTLTQKWPSARRR